MKKLFEHWVCYRNRIQLTDIAFFWRQFATLFSANISITLCCHLLKNKQNKPTMQQFICQLHNQILAGDNLFTCLKKYPYYFDNLICQLIKIGEQAGKLDEMLIRVAEYYERKVQLRKQLIKAAFYPMILCLTAIFILFCLFIWVIPRFAELYQNAGIKLPWITRCCFNLAFYLNHYFFQSLFFLFLLLVLLSTDHKNKMKEKVSQLPLIYHYRKKIMLAHFASNLAITFSAGLPIHACLLLSQEAITMQELTMQIQQLINDTHTGSALHRSMAHLTCFPEFMVQMVKIGEESGTLTHLLKKIADFMETEIEHLMNRLILLIEPLIMLILGVLIGGLVIGMYLPIFQLGSAI